MNQFCFLGILEQWAWYANVVLKNAIHNGCYWTMSAVMWNPGVLSFWLLQFFSPSACQGHSSKHRVHILTREACRFESLGSLGSESIRSCLSQKKTTRELPSHFIVTTLLTPKYKRAVIPVVLHVLLSVRMPTCNKSNKAQIWHEMLYRETVWHTRTHTTTQ